MGLILHPAAQREYDEAIAWYEEDYPGRGRRFREAVRGEITRIRAEGAHTFPRWRRTTFRAVVVPRFPYQLIFCEEPGRVVVVYAIAHDKRRPGYRKKRRARDAG